MQTRVYFQFAEAQPMFIMQSMINLKPQISNLKSHFTNTFFTLFP